MKKTVHFTDNYILNPTHQVTVNLIGCGGTGSQVLTALSRMSHTLIALNHPGYGRYFSDSNEFDFPINCYKSGYKDGREVVKIKKTKGNYTVTFYLVKK